MMQMATAIFGPYEIPDVYVLEERRLDIAQVRRTAGGPERRDAVDTKRMWEVATRPVLIEKVQEIEEHLDSILWGYDDWWIEDFGDPSNVVVARIDASTWTKGRILGLNEYRTMSFTVIER